MKVINLTVEVESRWDNDSGQMRDVVLRANGQEIWRKHNAHLSYQYEAADAEEIVICHLGKVLNG